MPLRSTPSPSKAMPLPAFRLREGLLSYPFALTKISGTVRPEEPFGESEARYRISG